MCDGRGKAVKIISFLLTHLPSDNNYKIIFMRRDIDEMDAIEIVYNDALADPRPAAEEINAFLGNKYSVNDMCSVIDPSLYRNRAKV